MKQLKRRQDLSTRTVEGEVVILDHRAGKIHQLNASASWIWNACDGEQSPEGIASRVAERFDCEATAVLADVHAALKDFEELGLLEDPV